MRECTSLRHEMHSGSMPNELLPSVHGVVHRSVLTGQGYESKDIRAAVRMGYLHRVRRAWYATADAPLEIVNAVRVGGLLTAGSLAQYRGLWTMPDSRLHVSVAQNASRLRTPVPRTAIANEVQKTEPACIHWRRSPGSALAVVAPCAEGLLQILECQGEEATLVALDSALNKQLVTRQELRLAALSGPARSLAVVAKIDGRSESGTETLVRTRLRRSRINVRVQVRIRGVGRVDILVGDRFVIECDSREWHNNEAAYASDRARDFVLVDAGYTVLRLTYAMVMFDWPRVEKLIHSKIAARQHRWPRSARTRARQHSH